MRIMKLFKNVTQATKALIITLMIGANVIGPVLLGPSAMAAETTYGVLNLSGNVPEIFRLDVRGASGDIDLNGGDGAAARTTVTNRLLGIFHLKVNIDIATFTVYTSNATGTFQNGATAYAFGGTGFEINVSCPAVALLAATVISDGVAAANLGDPVPGTRTNLMNAAGQPATVGFGVEQDCLVRGSWSGVTSAIPLAGVYSLPLVAQMVSI